MRKSERLSTYKDSTVQRVLLANPRGFCAGVTRAIEAVEHALIAFGSPVYVRRPIVHNRAVTDRLTAMGAVFVQEVDEVPKGSVLFLSAHGVAPSVASAARARGLRIIDATCPLVAKVHAHVLGHYRAGRHVILIGHDGHPEVIGTMGQVPVGTVSLVSRSDEVERLHPPHTQGLAYAVQTTFAVREAQAIVTAIEARFGPVSGPRASNICYATTNRQKAIEAIAAQADCVIVVGDAMSSNANRLVEVARAAGCPEALLVSDHRDLDWAMIGGARTVGLTAAASTPDTCVRNVCDALAAKGFAIVEYEGFEETTMFRAVSLAVP